MKARAILSAFAAFALALSSGAETETVGGYTWTYRVNGDMVEIWKDGGGGIGTAAVSPAPSGMLTIPSVLGGKTVTAIGDRAFRNCTGLTSVTIPRWVKSIGELAFDGTGLTRVNFDGPVGEIKADFDSAFNNTPYRTMANGNDDFADAQAISGSSGLITGLNIFATEESDEPIRDYSDEVAYTMWFKWTAPSDVKSAIFHTCHSDFDTVLGVFTGSSRLALTRVAADDDLCDNLTSKVKFAVTGGTTYYICVAGNWERGSFRLYWTTSSGTPVYANADGTLCGVAGDCPATLSIPSAVTRIADCAFDCDSDPSAKNITKVTIPDSVTSVGSGAFWGCKDSVFDTATLPGVKLVDGWAVGKTAELSGNLSLTGARGIAGNAFSGCADLSGVTIPSTVKGIGEGAFKQCAGLTSVDIPDSVVFLGEDAFFNCDKLWDVRLPVRLCAPGLESRAFGYCSSELTLTYVDYSTGVEFIVYDDKLKRVWLNGATSVTVPDGITRIVEGAFGGITELVSVTIPASVEYIDSVAFDGCDGLRSFTVAGDNRNFKSVNGLLLTKDGKKLVRGVNGDVTIPDGVTVIGDSAFYDFGNLTSVVIPASVTEIEECAFSGCGRLKSFTVASGNQNYKSVNGLLLTKDGKTLVCGLPGAVTIPAGVEIIGSYAFYECNGLTSVVITAGVKKIGDYAFRYCDGLTSVAIPASVTQIGDWAFARCDGLKTVTFDGNRPACGSDLYDGNPEDLVTYVLSGNATWSAALAAGTWQDRTIRAVVAPTFKVTLSKNGGTGGDNYVTVTYGQPMPTPRTAPKFSGYTFAGYWDTVAMDENGNPKGKQYYDANMKSVRNWDKKATATLWAKWTNKVTFGKNGGTGGDNYVTCTRGQPMPKRTMPTMTGYVFDGYWSTTGTDGVKYYNADGTSAHVWDRRGDTKLWAKWRKAAVVKVTFGKNGGTGGDNYVTATYGQPMPTPRTAPKLTGWTFAGYWDTLACDANGNPKGKRYYDANMKSVRNWDKTSATTLWAKWTVKVTLGKNGGTGGDSYVTVTKGQSFPTRSMPKKTGYAFGGYWVSASSKTGQCYNVDGTGTESMKWTTGGSPTIWALWTTTSSCIEVVPAAFAAPSVSAAPAAAEPAAIPAGLYSGVLADGAGSFCLILDEAEEGLARTAYLYVASEIGTLTAECTAEEVGGALLLTTEDGDVYAFDPLACTLVPAICQ